MPEHVLGEPQLRERRAVDRALEAIAVRRERGDLARRLAHEDGTRVRVGGRWGGRRRADSRRDGARCGTDRSGTVRREASHASANARALSLIGRPR